MPSKRDELIEMLKQLIGVKITVDVTRGGAIFKEVTGSETYEIIEIDGNLVTVRHTASGKETLHFLDVITVEMPLP